MDEQKTSKFLSFILRHKPESIGMVLNGAGWADVGELLEACESNGQLISYEDLKMIVKNDNKRRYEFSDDMKLIRASQGHSISIELGYSAKIPPAVLYHGTAQHYLAAIKQAGLLKQKRHHVHLTESGATATQVGARYGQAVLLTIDALAMSKNGFVFYQSHNDVWLTELVPPEYISFPFFSVCVEK